MPLIWSTYQKLEVRLPLEVLEFHGMIQFWANWSEEGEVEKHGNASSEATDIRNGHVRSLDILMHYNVSPTNWGSLTEPNLTDLLTHLPLVLRAWHRGGACLGAGEWFQRGRTP